MLSQKPGKKTALKVMILTFVLIATPFFVFSSKKGKIYVDDSASGTQNGSYSHPYKTIGQAMSAANKNIKIIVAKGTYRENVEIKNGVEVYGKDKDNTLLIAADKDKPVVLMRDKTEIYDFTIKGGSHGIKVNDDSRASIGDCEIKDNGKDGINIEAAAVSDSKKVSISDNVIRDNDGAGIYSRRRYVSISENEIINNDKDGIDLEKGGRAWIYKNTIEKNNRSGMKLRVDGSNIWTKSNTIKNNEREGVEVSFSGQAGRINIAKSKISKNDNFGVARVQRADIAGAGNLWAKYLTFDKTNVFEGNKKGGLSGIIRVK